MRLVPLVFLSACQLDPTFFGYWDIVGAEHAGEAQDDMGFLEVNDDGTLSLFLRYRWTGSAFEPDPRPALIFGDTDAERQELFANYADKDEVHTFWMSPFGADPFRVETYRADRAVLVAREAVWPGETLPAATALTLQR